MLFWAAGNFNLAVFRLFLTMGAHIGTVKYR